MKKYILIIAVLVAFTACKKEKDEPESVEFLTKTTLIGTMNVEQVKSIMMDYASFKTLVQTGISLYKIEYNTTLNNEKTAVSGMFVIPADVSEQTPVVVYNHGTMYKNEAPSFCNTSNYYMDIGLCYIFASILKCAILIPDYIGYGISSHTEHPYIHAESLGQTSLDIIRAYIDYTKITPEATPANKNVVILGYSEGGYVSVALHKRIQETAPDINIVKTYAGAGPYDIENFVKEVLRQNHDLPSYSISSYLWVLSTYKTYSGYSRTYDLIFSEADNEILKNNSYSLGYLANYPINLNPQNLFQEEFINMILNDKDTEFDKILKENTLTDFVPSDSLILFHSEADSWVYVNNTINAYDKMRRKGAPVRCEIIPAEENKDHGEAATLFFWSTVVNMFTTGELRIES
jgi:pimeloyl-ACP methyl ester carboxylesterase